MNPNENPPCSHPTYYQVANVAGGPLFQCANPECHAVVNPDCSPWAHAHLARSLWREHNGTDGPLTVPVGDVLARPTTPHTHADGDVGPHAHPGYPQHDHATLPEKA